MLAAFDKMLEWQPETVLFDPQQDLFLDRKCIATMMRDDVTTPGP